MNHSEQSEIYRISNKSSFVRGNKKFLKTFGAYKQNHLLQTNVFYDLAIKFWRSLLHNDPKSLLNRIKGIRIKLSSDDNPPVQDFMKTGIFSVLVKLLDPQDRIHVDLQNEIIWIITNVCSVSEDQAVKIIHKQLIETLSKFIWYPDDKIVEQVLWVFGNISGESDSARVALLELKVFEAISRFSKKAKTITKDLGQTLAWVLSNFTLTNELHEQFMIYHLFPLIQVFLLHPDPDICSSACWIYSRLTNNDDDRYFEMILNDKSVNRVIEVLQDDTLQMMLKPAIHIIGNIFSRDLRYARKVFNTECLKRLEDLILHRKTLVRKEVLWVLSNVLAEREFISEALSEPLLIRLLNVISTDTDLVRQEAILCFANALSVASEEQTEIIIDSGIINTLPTVLEGGREREVLPALDILTSILNHGSKKQEIQDLHINPYLSQFEEANLMEHIESLQTHPSNEVYQKVSNIIDLYFMAE